MSITKTFRCKGGDRLRVEFHPEQKAVAIVIEDGYMQRMGKVWLTPGPLRQIAEMCSMAADKIMEKTR